MRPLSRRTTAQHCCSASSSLFVALLCSCGGSVAANTVGGGSTTVNLTNQYALAYQKSTWASGVIISFPSDCSMTVSASGTPYQHQAYYLVPAMSGQTVVATTASGIQLAVSPYSGGLSNAKPISATFNVCPTKAGSATATGGGAIGFIASGTVLFNPYEATSSVALGDNASYTFTQSGTTYTAYFLDPCSQHTTGGNGGSTWHYHGTPTCWTSQVDGASGASHIIGIALDGFPIYGGRDVNGKVVDVASLDACNGITSATPEFPSGAYHYVLPIDANGNAITSKRSSLGCYAGTVNGTLSAAMKKLGCNMPLLLANGHARLPDGREVSQAEAATWMNKTMPGMQMAGAGTMPATNAAVVRNRREGTTAAI